MKKLLLFALCFILCAALFGCEMEINTSVDIDEISLSYEHSEQSKEQSAVLENTGLTADDTVVFFGDSIAAGYGLADEENERYSSLIAAEYGCTVYNYAVSGDDGKDLLELLAEGNCEHLKDATVIVLSIGANNVLKAADALIPYYEALQNGTAPETFDVTDVMNVVAQGIDRFKTELPQIIQALREVNADAKIIFQTVYNPYRDFTEFKVEQNGFTLSFAAVSASSVIALNDVIENGAEANGYTVCEVYTPFKEYEGNLINALPDGSNVDPHPNKEGHKLLAELVADAVK
ncbi:MAG: SGNH/GDSL hydrolase family protein [Clostridia bacterium]|nr:SGNH/GDSL hydrolase family protein [Clostridia bacterium]